LKTISKILSVITILTSICYAQTSVLVENIVTTAGYDTSVTVSLSNSIDINTLSLSIKYDPGNVTFNHDPQNGNYGIDSISLPGNNFLYSYDIDKGLISIVWINNGSVSVSGNLFNLNFILNNGFSEIEIVSARVRLANNKYENLLLSSGSLSTSSNSQLKLYNPNGGESYGYLSNPHEISWTSIYTDFVDLAYSYNDTDWIPIVDDLPASQNTFNWAVPDTFSNSVRIKISKSSDSLGVYDLSDGVFTVTNSETLTLLSLNAGEKLQANGAIEIKWNSLNVSNVKIEFSSDAGTSWSDISSSVSAEIGKYLWTIPNVVSTKCLIKISNVSNPITNDISDNQFEISSDPIQIVIPHIINAKTSLAFPYIPSFNDILSEVPVNSGLLTAVKSLKLVVSYDKEVLDFNLIDGYVNSSSELYKKGNYLPSHDDSTYTLFWLSNEPINLSGELDLLRCTYVDSADTIANKNQIFSELKIISAEVKNANNELIVLDLVNGSVSKTTNPAVKILSPKFGELYLTGNSPIEVKVSSVNVTGNLRLYYSTNNGVDFSNLSTTILPSTGIYDWDISSYSSSNSYRLFLSDGDAPASLLSYDADTSDVFQISNAKTLVLLSPDGGEKIQPDRAKKISWNSQNIDSIKIDFSLDNGVTWTNIVSNIEPSSGYYLWQVPDTTASNCLVAITDESNLTITDTSSTNFSIGTGGMFVRLTREGDLTPDTLHSVFVNFENVNSVTYMSFQFSFNNTVYSADSIYPGSWLNQNGTLIGSVSDTMVTVTWISQVPTDLSGDLLQVDGKFIGGTTGLKFLGAQIFDAKGVLVNILSGLKDGQLSEGVVGVENGKDNLPTQYFLDQNYPNPFNPTTTIKFAIPKASDVNLEVFSIIGEKVATLYSGYLQAGVHSINWNASKFTSGIYLYRIVTGNFVKAKKMILLK